MNLNRRFTDGVIAFVNGLQKVKVLSGRFVKGL